MDGRRCQFKLMQGRYTLIFIIFFFSWQLILLLLLTKLKPFLPPASFKRTANIRKLKITTRKFLLFLHFI